MALGIIRDDLDKVIQRLKEGDFDDKDFPNTLYQTNYKLSIDQKIIQLIPGTQVDPVAEYVVKYNDSDLKYSEEPPGILPYVNGAFQIKGGDPSPTQVGIPLLSNERMGKMGVRWLFYSTETRSNDDLTDWKRLTEDEVDELPERVKPNKESIKSSRSGKDPSPRITYPESVELVESRKDDYWWECWCARSQELMDTWRVLVPNTAKNPLPTILGPANTIVADNFNVVIQPDGKTAVAVASVLGTQTAQDFLREISPWSKGDTPRPRIKHVAATIHQNKKKIETILNEREPKLGEIKSQIHQFHHDTLSVLRKYIENTPEDVATLRDYYTSISDQSKLNSEINGVSSGDNHKDVTVKTEQGEVKVEFHEAEYAASMAIATWIGAGFGDTINETLSTQSVSADLDAVKAVLYNKTFYNFCEIVEKEYF